MTRTDAELVSETLQGNPQAFAEIVKRYQKLVFNIVYHYLGNRNEVEDTAQEVFLRVFQSLEHYDAARSLGPWIARITANRCLDELRKARKQKVALFSDLSQNEGERIEFFFDRFIQGDSLNPVQAEESFKIVRKAMEEFPEKEKVAFVLRELEGFSYSQIAQTLGTTEVAARIRVSRLRKKLQEKLKRILYAGNTARK